MEKVFGLCARLSTPTAAQQRLGDSAFHVGGHSVGTSVLTGSTSDNVRNTFTTGSRCWEQTVTALGLALISPALWFNRGWDSYVKCLYPLPFKTF